MLKIFHVLLGCSFFSPRLFKSFGHSTVKFMLLFMYLLYIYVVVFGL